MLAFVWLLAIGSGGGGSRVNVEEGDTFATLALSGVALGDSTSSGWPHPIQNRSVGSRRLPHCVQKFKIVPL
jgi:hypothetical protein